MSRKHSRFSSATPTRSGQSPGRLPDDFRAAVLCHERGEFGQAEHLCKRILLVDPRHFDAMHLLGLILARRGEGREAEPHLRRSIELDPENYLTRMHHANVLTSLGRLEEALGALDRAVALRPSDADVVNARGAVLMDLKRPAEALASFDKAIALRPSFPEALHHRGAALMMLGRREEALASFDKAIAARPAYAEAHLNRATVLKHLERLDEAIEGYDRAIAVKPGFARALKNRAYCKLLRGEFKAGLADYEHRWLSEDFPSRRPPLDAPHWLGEPLAGRSILVYFEQGLGDTIQFSRYLPLLSERGADVRFLCPAHLWRLLGTLSGPIRLVDRIDPCARPDFQCALMSLPLRLGTDLGTIPADTPYLSADPQRSAYWAGQLPASFRVGVAWQGNPATSLDAGRSIALRDFEPIARIEGVRLISLQKSHGLDQLGTLPAGMEVHTLGAGFDGGPDAFIDTAAVMEHLDLVISVDTSVAHLAGALGRPIWVALKRVPDWRWMMGRSDSPWYPTAKLFRQTIVDDWRDVIRDMAAEVHDRPAEGFASRRRTSRVQHAGSFTGLPQLAGARRNEPCPCGSGKRYKHCHGALA